MVNIWINSYHWKTLKNVFRLRVSWIITYFLSMSCLLNISVSLTVVVLQLMCFCLDGDLLKHRWPVARHCSLNGNFQNDQRQWEWFVTLFECKCRSVLKTDRFVFLKSLYLLLSAVWRPSKVPRASNKV